MTDFGTAEHYVGAVKGNILKINSLVQIVDITHSITPFNVMEASFLLYCYYKHFPERCTHVVIVDPGVGTSRRNLLAATHEYYFMVPDNGVLSHICAFDEIESVREINAEHYYNEYVSNTFHARDIYAPCVAWKSRGIEADNFGDKIDDYIKLEIPEVKRIGGKILKGRVMHIDNYGNIITNISRNVFLNTASKNKGKNPKVIIAGKEFKEYRKSYAGAQNELFFLIGGTDHIEIASSQASAQDLLNLEYGKEVGIMFD